LQAGCLRSRESSIGETDLGDAGELAVLKMERQNLIDRGRADLADNIVHISQIEEDGAGYDSKSYTHDGDVKCIEVEITKGGLISSCYVSKLEVAFSKKCFRNYYLYRSYDFAPEKSQGSFLVKKGKITDYCEFQPVKYRVVLK